MILTNWEMFWVVVSIILLPQLGLGLVLGYLGYTGLAVTAFVFQCIQFLYVGYGMAKRSKS